MSKKIVAIGGGENGRMGSDGIRYPYELANQDKEIIRLTGKEHPTGITSMSFRSWSSWPESW